jgi:hypothetical protein
MILQMMRNECVRFGGHVDIEVRYKMYYRRLKFCIIYLALNRGCFKAVLMKNTPKGLIL